MRMTRDIKDVFAGLNRNIVEKLYLQMMRNIVVSFCYKYSSNPEKYYCPS